MIELSCSSEGEEIPEGQWEGFEALADQLEEMVAVALEETKGRQPKGDETRGSP